MTTKIGLARQLPNPRRGIAIRLVRGGIDEFGPRFGDFPRQLLLKTGGSLRRHGAHRPAGIRPVSDRVRSSPGKRCFLRR